MKKINFIILIFGSSSILNAQTIDFGKFPSENNDEKPILTSYLLKSLNWDALKTFCDSTEGHYAYKRNDSLLIRYEYVQQGRVADFKLTSYNGKVLEYESQISNTSKETNTNYFDKNVWLEYANNYLTKLPDSLKLRVIENKNILKSYYQLLGVGTFDEYGWTCEYSAVGRPTDRRIAVIGLLSRPDLLWKLFDYSNIHVKLYIVDALIYNDYKTKQLIEQYKKTDRETVRYLKKELLKKSDWEKIYELRDTNQNVNSCRNGTGSYKIYKSTTSELLNDKAILEIPKKYEELKKMGYLW